MNKYNHRSQKNKEWVGYLIILFGLLFLGRSFDFPLPEWLFSWPMFMVALGLSLGVSNRFKDWSWAVITGIGAIFLIDKIAGYDVRLTSMIFPLLLIVLGIRLLRKKKPKTVHMFDEESGNFTNIGADESLDDRIEVIAIFGGNKKIMVSKNFKGGEIVSVFGGNEINLSKCDITGRVKIEIVQVFGGTKLVVPANWRIQTDMVSILGGMDDKRNVIDFDADDSKVLVIEGVSVLAGIDIRSY
jgi:predicted membrane protein